MDLSGEYDATIRFIETVREVARKRIRGFTFDFRTLDYISPAAALVLAAELDLWSRSLNMRPRAIDVNKWNPNVRRLLREMGFFKLLNPRNVPREQNPPNGGLRFIPFRSRTEVVGAEAVSLRQEIEALSGPLRGPQELYSALTEAMTNVRHHAYLQGDPRDFQLTNMQRWWMSGSFDAATGQLTVIFFDRGVGIPETLPRTLRTLKQSVGNLLMRLALQDNDASRIKAATEIGRSKTGQPHRGKGIPEMMEFVRTATHGRMHILSGRGEYIYLAGGTDEMRTLRRPLGGTLISWEIPISPPAEEVS